MLDASQTSITEMEQLHFSIMGNEIYAGSLHRMCPYKSPLNMHVMDRWMEVLQLIHIMNWIHHVCNLLTFPADLSGIECHSIFTSVHHKCVCNNQLLNCMQAVKIFSCISLQAIWSTMKLSKVEKRIQVLDYLCLCNGNCNKWEIHNWHVSIAVRAFLWLMQ